MAGSGEEESIIAACYFPVKQVFCQEKCIAVQGLGPGQKWLRQECDYKYRSVTHPLLRGSFS